jgi:ABC-type transport system involved in cytochrome c biogenesis permease subunit
VVGYALACSTALIGIAAKRRPERTILALMFFTALAHTASIGLRWVRLDHVPVGSMFEMLSANVWGLMVALTVAYWRLPRLRPTAAIGLPVIVLLMGWMLLRQGADSTLPRTYNTVWLFIHIGFIKLFLGYSFVAVVQSAVVMARWFGARGDRLSRLPDDQALIGHSYRFLAVAWVFDSLGIVAGAIWANDAWGRYWSWDALESWSLITWLTIGGAMHANATFKLKAIVSSLLVLLTFLVAFFTFFGIPFVSTALHKGAI